ncbi:MAG TPA: hypothetical protein VGK24_00080 [Candidatus Angelobacter sp.]
MRFFGKTFVREEVKQDPNSNIIGDSLQKAIDREVMNAEANQRALQTARANEAKRRRDEDKAVAAMLATDYQRG